MINSKSYRVKMVKCYSENHKDPRKPTKLLYLYNINTAQFHNHDDLT